MTQDELREASKASLGGVLCAEPPALVDESSTKWCRRRRAALLSFTLSEMYIRYWSGRGRSGARAGGLRSPRRRHRRAPSSRDGRVRRPRSGAQATMRGSSSGWSPRGWRGCSAQGAHLRAGVPRRSRNQRVQRVIDGLTRARLVVSGLETEGDPYVEPAHDELVRAGTNCGTGSGGTAAAGRSGLPAPAYPSSSGVGRGEGREAGDRPSLADASRACCWSRCSSRAMLGPIK
jgi:hypothetical protein